MTDDDLIAGRKVTDTGDAAAVAVLLDEVDAEDAEDVVAAAEASKLAAATIQTKNFTHSAMPDVRKFNNFATIATPNANQTNTQSIAVAVVAALRNQPNPQPPVDAQAVELDTSQSPAAAGNRTNPALQSNVRHPQQG
jgi:hypothetical protein